MEIFEKKNILKLLQAIAIFYRSNHSISLQKHHLVLDQEVPLEPHLRKQEVEIRVRVLCRPRDHSQGQPLLEVKDRHQGKAQVGSEKILEWFSYN